MDRFLGYRRISVFGLAGVLAVGMASASAQDNEREQSRNRAQTRDRQPSEQQEEHRERAQNNRERDDEDDDQAQLDLQGTAIQGGLMIGKVAPRSRVTLDGRRIRISEDGDFLIGFAKNAPKRATLLVVAPGGARERRVLEVEQREYGTDRIDDLPSEMVELDDAMRRQLRDDNRGISRIRAQFTPEAHFRNGFEWPARGRIAASYGTERVLNGKPRNDHEGIDIAVPVGTPVRAPADGVIAFVDQDVALAGRVVLIDHGQGLTTSFLHLNDTAVTEGQQVSKGDTIGHAGQTGRTTGPHLHWGANLFQVALDPALLVGERPSRPVGTERTDAPVAPPEQSSARPADRGHHPETTKQTGSARPTN